MKTLSLLLALALLTLSGCRKPTPPPDHRASIKATLGPCIITVAAPPVGPFELIKPGHLYFKAITPAHTYYVDAYTPTWHTVLWDALGDAEDPTFVYSYYRAMPFGLYMRVRL